MAVLNLEMSPRRKPALMARSSIFPMSFREKFNQRMLASKAFSLVEAVQNNWLHASETVEFLLSTKGDR
jgi:hypothetical protein